MGDVPLNAAVLAGEWDLVESDEPHDSYPVSIEFQDDGSYLVPMDDGVFRLWQSGDYEILGEEEISIQTANDAMLSYRCRLADDVLVFTDASGFKFSYCRRS